MDEDQALDVGMEQPEGLETIPEAPEPPGDDADLDDLPLFGGDEDGGDEAEEGQPEDAPENAPEDGQEAQEDPEAAPRAVEVDGRQVPVQELVQAAAFGRQAAAEVAELREQLAVVDEFAREAGMGRDEYMGMMRRHVDEARLQREADSMGVTPEAARQMREARIQQQAAQEALQRQQQAQLEEQQRRARVAPYLELIQRYPELSDPTKMPPEVMEQIQRGAHPVIAYQDFMLRQRQAAEQVARQRQAVKGKTPGSAAGVGDGQVDDALAAFMAELDN